jgi:acyl carrier protein
MQDDALRETVLETLSTIAPEIDLAGLDPDINFRDQAELDSVDYLNFVLALERALGAHIPEQDYPRLSCLSGCIAYLSARQDPPAG